MYEAVYVAETLPLRGALCTADRLHWVCRCVAYLDLRLVNVIQGFGGDLCVLLLSSILWQ